MSGQKKKVPAKKKAPARKKKDRLRAVRATNSSGDFLNPITWIKPIIGVLLIPVCLVTARTFLTAFFETSAETAIIGSAPLWFFFIGVAVWLIAFWGLPRPVTLYVLGHEATHALFVYICLGRVAEFKVNREGGYIVTDKNNLLISLSPYFVPIYSMLVILGFAIAGIWVNIAAYHPGVLFWGQIGFSWSWLLFFLVGLTWAFHFTFTAWMISKNQPDLKQNGTFFSLVFIFLTNIILLSAMLIMADTNLTYPEFVFQWKLEALRIIESFSGRRH